MEALSKRCRDVRRIMTKNPSLRNMHGMVTYLNENLQLRRYTAKTESLRSMNRRNSKSGDSDRKYHNEQLLPGIPDALTIAKICPKISWSVLNVMMTVSHGWLQAIQSREIFEARSFCEAEQTATVFRVNTHDFALYSEEDDLIYYLPEIPVFESDATLASITYTSLNGKLYVMGSVREKEEDSSAPEVTPCGPILELSVFVYVYDLAGHIGWKKCAIPKFDIQPTGSVVMNGKLFVYGETQFGPSHHKALLKSAIYDPDADVWSLITKTDFDHFKVLTNVFADLSWYGFWEVPTYFPDAQHDMWDDVRRFFQVDPCFQCSEWIRRTYFESTVPIFCSAHLDSLRVCKTMENWKGIAVTIINGRFFKITQHGFDIYNSHTDGWTSFLDFCKDYDIYSVQIENTLHSRNYYRVCDDGGFLEKTHL